MLNFLAEKVWVAFAEQKLLTFFQQKNTRILCIESAKTVNEMTLNELVKLTTLWTTGPWSLWSAMSENVFRMCAQERFRSDCALPQSDQNLQWAHFARPRIQSFLRRRTTKTLIRLHSCVGCFESSLGAYVGGFVFSCGGSYTYVCLISENKLRFR